MYCVVQCRINGTNMIGLAYVYFVSIYLLTQKILLNMLFCSVLIYIKPLHNRFKFIHDSKFTNLLPKTIIYSSFLGIFFNSEEDLTIASFDIFIFRTHKGTISDFEGKMSDLTKILTESQGKHW